MRRIHLLASVASLCAAISTQATVDSYSIGLNFGSNEAGGALTAADTAGVPAVRQQNWNNFEGGGGANMAPVVADNSGTSVNTSLYVEWTSNGTWASTGRGEENNGFPTGPDRALMTGYLDTGNSTTTTITVLGLPTELTSGGYDVYIYALGGVSGRGGGYRIINAADNSVLRNYKLGDSPLNPTTYVEDPGLSHSDRGNYILFRNLTSDAIIVEATTASGQGGGGTPRAPVNGLQFVKSTGDISITGIIGTPVGFVVTVEDSVTRTLDPNSISLSLNGTALPGANISVSKTGGVSRITFGDPSTPLTIGSTNQVNISVKDSSGATATSSLSFVVPNYTIVPAGYAVPGANASEPGFKIRTVQLPSGVSLQNTTRDAELLLAGKFIDPNTGQPAANMANPPTSIEPETINYNYIAPSPAGNFSSDNGAPDKPFPGIPGTQFETVNFAMEATTYLELAAGTYVMGVNSDDGFKVSVAPNAPDVAGLTLGEFSGGRAAGNTQFSFVITQSGVYPFRLIYEQGGGDASLEWFMVVDGQRILINDTANAKSVRAFRSSTGATRPVITDVSPISGTVKVPVNSTVSFTIQDGSAQVVANSIQLMVNGQTVAATVNKTGSTTTVSFKPDGGLANSSPHTVELTYTDSGSPAVTRTVTLNFVTERVPNQLPPLVESNGLVVIEAENFDANTDRGGKSWTFGNTIAGFAGEGYMVALPDVDSGTQNDPFSLPTASPQMDYKVQFTTPGNYFLWVRGYGPSGGSDSMHVGLDSVAQESSIRITGFNQTFSWRRARQGPSAGNPFIEVTTAGEHVVNVWMREDGTIVDRILLTSDAAFVPTEPGPGESLRVGQVAPVVVISSPTAGAKFANGASIPITADATVQGGATISKVEFFANGTKIGESTSAPFTVNFSGAAQGRYTITASATTSQNVTRTSAGVKIVVGNPPDEILYVNGSGGPNAADNAIISHLKDLGFDVVSVTGPNSKTGDALDKVLVIISSTVGSGDVNTKFTEVAVPVVNWEQALQDDLLMTGNIDGTDRGTAGGNDTVLISDATHPMAAGLAAGPHLVATATDNFAWGVPAFNAQIVAVLNDGTVRPIIYGYEKGALLIDGTTPAPARRAHLFLTDNNYLRLNETGVKLVDAVFGWAMGRELGAPAPQMTISKSGNQITISWTNGGTLQSKNSLSDAQWTNEAGSSPVTIQATGDMKFFRVAR